MNAVIHGTWSAGVFFLWGESAAPAPRRRGRQARVPAHPFAASPAELRAALQVLAPGGAWDEVPEAARTVLLPTRAGVPVRPPWLAPETGEADPADEAGEGLRLAPWKVTGLTLDVLQALDLLIALPSGRPDRREWGADLRFWSLAAKLGLEFLAGHRYLPGFVEGAGPGDVRAAWLPWSEEPDDLARMRTLAAAMPLACRAVFLDGRPDPEPPAPHALLEGFVRELVDRAVRDWGRTAPDRRRLAASGLAGAWWEALWSEGETQIVVPASQRRELAHLAEAWRGWLSAGQLPGAADAPFRLCFRLEPPETDPETGEVVSPDWTLRYLLQARDDPSLLLPAGQVWQVRGAALQALGRRFEGAQERLLAWLGIAARLFAPIRDSLRAARPEVTTLAADQAYAFLREVGPLLEGMGFGVLVPPWWNKPGARLALRARLRTGPAAASSGILTHDSLVDFRWELALGDQPLTREEFERLVALKMPLVQVRGRWVMLRPDQIEAAIAFWDGQARKRRQGSMPLPDALALALGATGEVDGLPVAGVDASGWLDELLARLRAPGRIEDLPQPDGLNGELRPYQVRGVSWLAFLRRWGLGACLADDMGLGKTPQAIALLLHERGRSRNGSGPALIVCPTSVVGNWQREVQRFAPGLRVMVHHGSERAGGEALLAAAQEHDVVISTYGLLRRDVEHLARVPWSDVILDEAQNIKNPHAKQSQAARRLGEQAANRVALTGTPVENRLSELWSIMHFLNPGLLGSEARFRKAFALPIERYQDPEAMQRLRRLAGPFILRRVKTDPAIIQDLPDKLEMKVYCTLTPEQATLYEAVVQESLVRIDEAGEALQEGMGRRGAILSALLRLKQVCNHPAQFLGDGSALPARSGKLDRLAEMLEEALSAGDRALVFTQFAEMGHLLQAHLGALFGVEVLYLHGGTPASGRDRMVARFQAPDGPPLFILSLKAGGTGLNLTAANHVFHFDRWWNPAVENQATDRAFRIGQTRNVQVHKLLCAGTLEERIDELIESKKELAESVVGAGEAWLTELSTDELRDLIALRQDPSL